MACRIHPTPQEVATYETDLLSGWKARIKSWRERLRHLRHEMNLEGLDDAEAFQRIDERLVGREAHPARSMNVVSQSDCSCPGGPL